ncbi:MAG: hypothetical protein ACWGHO_02725 [Candidatus Moraniibacteriota bacterium]
MDNKKYKFNLYFGIILGLYLVGMLLSSSFFHGVEGSIIDILANLLAWSMRTISLIGIILISGIFAVKVTAKNYFGWFALLQIIILTSINGGELLVFPVCFVVIKILENKFAIKEDKIEDSEQLINKS